MNDPQERPAEVSLPEVLEARERRVNLQQELLREYGLPLICFTMNIAGPIKDSPLIRRGFARGLALLRGQLLRCGLEIRREEQRREKTGCEAYLVVDGPARQVKDLTVELEESSELGRLFDLDVLPPDGAKLERKTPRACLICGKPGRACARSRAHTVAELQAKTREILTESLAQADRNRGASLAVEALLYEVNTTPKPGLVDRRNNGSHRDMDIYTFLTSASALWPYFARCIRVGQETAGEAPEVTFTALRQPGREAEGEMLLATGGVNTHKGAIFSLGVLCGALGRLDPAQWKNPETICQTCAAMTRGLVERDFAGVTAENAQTTGERLYARHGITGIRGQMEAGLPGVLAYGLPALERVLDRGGTLDEAGGTALMALLAQVEDTNLMKRGGLDRQQACARQAGALLETEPILRAETLEELDRNYIRNNLSPGGTADLLAITYFLHFLKTRSNI